MFAIREPPGQYVMVPCHRRRLLTSIQGIGI